MYRNRLMSTSNTTMSAIPRIRSEAVRVFYTNALWHVRLLDFRRYVA